MPRTEGKIVDVVVDNVAAVFIVTVVLRWYPLLLVSDYLPTISYTPWSFVEPCNKPSAQ